MNVSAPFIIRPIATTLLMIGLTLLGLVAYFVLPIAGVPQVDVPTVRVTAKLPGANAETMATSVATPLEGQLSLTSGVTSISSASSLGITQIQVEFDLARSIEGAAQDVQTAINAAGGLLPKNLPSPPTYEKVNPADAQLMSIAVTSPDLPISKVDEYVENFLAPQISRLVGVGLVDYHGQQKPAIRVQINPAAAAAIGITLEDVRAALGTATVNSPKGTLDGPKQSLTLDTTDQIFDSTTFNDAIVAYRNGAPVRVRDLGAAVDGVESVREAAWFGGQRAVIIDVHKRPGYNINQTVQRVKDALPDLQRPLPPSIKLQVMGDRTQTIRASVVDVQLTMAISIGLVVMVMFLFLRHVWATVIPSVTIPVSLLATCAVMYLAGYTLDNVSLMALTIAVGFIIDDAVVMMSVSPLTINHTDQFPSVTLSFNLAPGYALGDALTAIGDVERSVAKPATLTARFQGSARVFETSLSTQPYLIAAAIIAVYIVLGVLYESFIHPITILSTLPSAGVGAFLALMVLHYDFSLIALIGVILLVGIVKKNAIMMIDFALVGERTRNLTAEQSIYEASLMRYRPIMMTTMAALLGGLPLALGAGPGSELRRPLGIAIVGGLLLSQFLNLYTTPVIYIYLAKFVDFFRSAIKAGQDAGSDGDQHKAPRLHAAE